VRDGVTEDGVGVFADGLVDFVPPGFDGEVLLFPPGELVAFPAEDASRAVAVLVA